MFARLVWLIAGLAVVMPAAAGEMKPDEARRFVVGKLFSFSCFEGSSGTGRIFADGSVSGVLKLRGGAARYVTLPAGTLRVKGEAICASMRGMPFEPCFDLVRTDGLSFRGSVAGLNFAYCEFTRRGGRAELVRTTSLRRSIHQEPPAAALRD